MTIYWLLFVYFAIGALLVPLQSQRGGGSRFFLFVGMAAMALLIGLRYRVGTDWNSYRIIFAQAARGLDRMTLARDPAYEVLNWLVQQLGAGIWLVNLTCAMLFCWGLWRFAKAQRDSWLAVVVAVPYLVIVVAMGYTRQAVAIGFVLAGLATLARSSSPMRFIAFAIAGALFHKSAVVVIPLVLLAGRRDRVINIVIGLAITYLLYDTLISGSTGNIADNYISTRFDSQGAQIRLALSILPALLLLIARRQLDFPEHERLVWRNFSFAAFGLLGLLLVLPSATIVDRLALYLFPLQLAVMARVPGGLLGVGVGRLAVVIYAMAIQVVWLNYAAHARDWLPYRAFGFG